MKSISKIVLAALLFLPAPALAVDVGTQLIVSGGAAGNGGGRPLDWIRAHQVSTCKLLGWFDLPFIDDSSFGLAGQASLKYQQENSYDTISYINLVPDVDLLRFYYNNYDEKGGFSLSLGRFTVTDKTATIINQKIDGLYLGYSARKMQFGVYAGYTGLLNAKNTLTINSSGKNYWSSLVSNSLYNVYLGNINKVIDDYQKKSRKVNISDVIRTVDWAAVGSDVGRALYVWAEPYFISSANLTFPYLIANQTPYIEASMAINTEGPSKIEDEFDRFYLTGGLYGPLIYSDLMYNISTTFSTYGDKSSSKSAFEGLANLSKIKLTYFTNFHSLAISGELTYASGDNGIYDPFYGFTSNPISYMRYGPEHTSAIKYGLSAVFKPTREFLVTLGSDQLFSYKENVAEYLGWQYYTELKLQCTSDFQFQVKAYRFLADDRDYDNTGATVTAVFTF